MCDMYGHAYWRQDTEEVIEDFLKCNSHGELGHLIGYTKEPIPFRMTDAQIRHLARGLGLNREDNSAGAMLKVAVRWLHLNGAQDVRTWAQPDPNYELGVSLHAFGMTHNPPVAPCGLDPVDGKVIFHRDPKPPDPQLAIAKLTARWDMAFPTTKELEPWIENHFGKRGDLENWQVRTALLLCDDATRRLGHMRRDVTFQYVGPPKLFPKPDDIPVEVRCAFVPTAGEAIDLLRKFPNDWWADRNRRGPDAIRKHAEKSLVGVEN